MWLTDVIVFMLASAGAAGVIAGVLALSAWLERKEREP